MTMKPNRTADGVGTARRTVSPSEDRQVSVSVVIPCFNSEDTLGEQLDALAAQQWTAEWEVIVADNGSTDGTVAIAESYRGVLPGLKIVDASGRRGAAYARNQGSQHARGRSLVFCDADDVVAPGWLRAIGTALERHDFVASHHEWSGAGDNASPAGRQPVQRSELQHLWYPPYLDHAGGCGLGVRAEIFQSHGGFDEDLPVLQDTDLCLRLELAGTDLHFVPAAVIYIRYREDGGTSFRQARRWAEYNVRLCKRYRSAHEPIPGGWPAWFRESRRLALTLGRYLLHPKARAGLTWQYGWHVGLLQGAVRYRIPPVALDNGEWKRVSSGKWPPPKRRIAI